MKLKRFFMVIGLGCGAVGGSTQAALLNFSQYQSGPDYSDFTANNLDVNYVYTGNSTSGTGVLTVEDPFSNNNPVTESEHYAPGSKAPGTGSTYYNSGNGTGFTGSYLLTADISFSSTAGVSLTSGSFKVEGALAGGSASSVLLQGNLVTGAGNVAFGYENPGSANFDEFDFLINLSSLSGNLGIEQDFLNYLGGTGGIIVNAGFSKNTTHHNAEIGGTTVNESGGEAFQGLWDQSFANAEADATADTFVPEPAAYPWAASIGALLGCAGFARRTLPFARAAATKI